MKRSLALAAFVSLSGPAWSGWFDEAAVSHRFYREVDFAVESPPLQLFQVEMPAIQQRGSFESVVSTLMTLEGSVDYRVTPLMPDYQGTHLTTGSVFVRSNKGSNNEVLLVGTWREGNQFQANGQSVGGTAGYSASQSWVGEPFGGVSTLSVRATLVANDPLVFETSGTIRGKVKQTVTAMVDPDAFRPQGGGQANDQGSLLRQLFLWATDSVVEPSPAPNQSGGGGLRGDALPFIRNDLLTNPTPQLGEIGVWLETASPASIYHAIDAYAAPQRLSFDLTFLTASGDFSVLLGQMAVFSMASNADLIGRTQRIDIELDAIGDSSELAFLLDGASGQDAVLTNLTFGDLGFDDRGWYSREHGRSSFIYAVTNEQIATLNAMAASVPEPQTVLMLGLGLLVVGRVAARRRPAAAIGHTA